MPPAPAAKRKRDRCVDAIEDNKSPIEPAAGPSKRPAIQPIVISDSGDEEESETDEASRLEQIRKYKVSLCSRLQVDDLQEALERLGNAGKGKGMKRANVGEGEENVKVEGCGTSIKVEQEQRNVRAIDTGHIHTTQTAQTQLPITQALARLSVDPESANVKHDQAQDQRLDITLDEKPNVNAIAGPSSAAEQQPSAHKEDSEGEEDSEKEQRNMLWEIEMHQVSALNHPTSSAYARQKAIERLKRGIEDKGKGKGKKRAKVEHPESSVKIETGRKEEVEGGQAIDLTEDSD